MIELPSWVVAVLVTWAVSALWFHRKDIHSWFGF